MPASRPPTLGPNVTLLHFRLVEKIGEGGMGEVWRAVDTTLDREVAIKVLPAALAEDPQRLARFEREARVLASLNHPNIAAIYGFPDAGAANGNIRFLALELVRGEDLAQVLARGPLPLPEVLDAARQIAAALEAAHDRGVVHRDLKPANVKRTPEGQVKVLDFGLAKALEPGAPGSEQSATVTSAGTPGATVAGVILGTASYMSPEQARALPVDRRTDLWAFGCVLYEMLTGTKAFDGETVTDVLAGVVRAEPDWERLPPETPLPVRRLLRRCLEKDPRRRLRDAGDASLLLEDNPEDARPAPPSRAAPVPAPRRRRPGRVSIALAAVALAASASAAGWWFGHQEAPPGDAPGVTFHRITYSRGMLRAARFAPDGQTIVYGAAWDGPPVRLYLARTDASESTPLALPPGELLSVSRGGEVALALGFAYTGWMGDGTLARTSLLGGTPREMLEHVRSADFSPDGAQFAVVRRVDGLDRLEYPPGTVLHANAGYITDVRVAPDGEHVAFSDHPVWGDDRGDVAVVDRAGRKTVLARDFASLHGIAWAPGGREVWYTGQRSGEADILAAADLAGRTRVIYTSMGSLTLFDIAADGRVLIADEESDRQALALLAGFPEPRSLVVPGEASVVRSLSRDGSAALVSDQLTHDYDAYLVRADRPGAVHLSSGDGMAISPDGTQALMLAADARSLLVAPLGMGASRRVPTPAGLAVDGTPAWLPDGRRAVFVGRVGEEPARGYVCEVATGGLAPFGEAGLSWPYFGPPPVSPDGREVVLLDARGVARRWPVAGGAASPVPGVQPGDMPLTWTEDGRALFVATRAIPIPIERLDLASGRRTAWLTITPRDTAGLRVATPVITPDGRHWALSASRLLSRLHVADGLR